MLKDVTEKHSTVLKEMQTKINEQKELMKDVKEKHSTALKELQTKMTDQKLAKDTKEEKKNLLKICRNRIKMQEQENKKWKVDTAASLSVKQLHAKELLELEKSHVKKTDVDIDRLRKEKAAVEKSLGAKRMTKEKLV